MAKSRNCRNPATLDAFIEQVVPIMQKRGLFRTEYTGTTLRGHYGLNRPDTGFDAQGEQVA